jgi:predicted nucleic-acid-binding protein
MVEVFQTLMAIENFKIDRLFVVASAVRQYSDSKADFADCLIERLCSAAGCEHTITFDKPQPTQQAWCWWSEESRAL